MNAPYKFAIFVATNLFDSVFGLRLVGAAIGGLSIMLFFMLCRKLFDSLVAIAITVMFASSSLLLATVRTASPEVMLLGLLALIATGYYMRFGKNKDLAWILAALVVSLQLYTPGMIFFIVPAIIWQFRHARKSFEQLRTPTIVTVSVLMGLLLVPIVVSLIRDPVLWRAYLGLPETFAPVVEMAKYAGTAIISLVAISPDQPDHWLGRQPVLDIFAAAMFVYGVYKLLSQWKLDRLWTLGGLFLLALLWIGVGTNRLGIVILLPFVYLIVGIGIQNFINLWLKVFPRNPIARTAGVALLGVAIILSVNFQIYRYFIAWPNADKTEALFDKKYPN